MTNQLWRIAVNFLGMQCVMLGKVNGPLRNWDSEEGEEKSKGMECCPLNNHVSYLKREKYEDI